MASNQLMREQKHRTVNLKETNFKNVECISARTGWDVLKGKALPTTTAVKAKDGGSVAFTGIALPRAVGVMNDGTTTTNVLSFTNVNANNPAFAAAATVTAGHLDVFKLGARTYRMRGTCLLALNDQTNTTSNAVACTIDTSPWWQTTADTFVTNDSKVVGWGSLQRTGFGAVYGEAFSPAVPTNGTKNIVITVNQVASDNLGTYLFNFEVIFTVT